MVRNITCWHGKPLVILYKIVWNLTKESSVMTKTKELGTRSISSLLIKFSVPAVIAMLINAI